MTDTAESTNDNAHEWAITVQACDGYMHALGWRIPDRARACRELSRIIATATHKDTDADGRQLWRCSKRVGRAMRCVVDPRGYGPPRLIWVGRGVPPNTLWMTRY